jgi:MFS family permease
MNAPAGVTTHPGQSRWAQRFGLPRLDRPGSIALFAATWIDAVGSGLFFTFYLLYLTKSAGFSLGTAGAVLSIASGFALAANPIAGSLVDRIGARRMTIFSQILCMVGYGALFFVDGSLPLLVAAATLAVLGERIFWVGFPSFISIMASDHERDRWFAFIGMTREAGFGVGGLLAALVIAVFGNSGYQILVVANAASFGIATFIIWSRVPSPPVEPIHHDHGGWRAVVRDRPVMKMALANTAACLTILIAALTMPIYAVDDLDLPAWLPGLLFVNTTVVLTLGQSLALRYMSGWRRTRIFVLAAAIWFAGAMTFALAQVVPKGMLIAFMFFAVTVTIFGDLFHAPQTNGLPSAMAPVALRGRYLALFSLSWGIARTIAPGIVSALHALGPTWPWVGMVLMAIVMMGITINAERDLDVDRQRMPRLGNRLEPVRDDTALPGTDLAV